MIKYGRRAILGVVGIDVGLVISVGTREGSGVIDTVVGTLDDVIAASADVGVRSVATSPTHETINQLVRNATMTKSFLFMT
jgi:hypothetical protein